LSDLLKSGAAWLNATRAAKLASNVTYRRGGSGTGFTLAGTVGRTEADQVAEGDLISSAGIRDFIFTTSDFDVSSVFTPPAARDTVEDEDGILWQVAEIGGEPCWRYSDAHKNAIRVHVIKVGS
jgi:hypothetical protein